MAIEQQLPHFALTSARQRQHTLTAFSNPFALNSRLTVVLTVTPAATDQQCEVVITGLVHRQQTDGRDFVAIGTV